MISERGRSELGWGAAVWLLCVAVYLAYLPGHTGGLNFDDSVNLSALESVADARTASYFVFGGISGPTGRPLSLLTFLIDQPSWPNHLPALIRTNSLIHIFNGVLLAWLVIRISRISKVLPERSGVPLAFAVATLWMCLPILSSSALMIVQRMTLVSGSFTLAGLLLYVMIFAVETRRTRLRALAQLLVLAVFTVLATLSKENGALLPIYALSLEMFLLRGAGPSREMRALRQYALMAAVGLIVLYMLSRAITMNWGPGHREYLPLERLLTQPMILFEYLHLAFVPRPNLIMPFHDDHFWARGLFSPPWVAVSIIGWAGLIAAALVWRNRYPLFAFAVFWFLGGHLIESTFINLELYFDHRNYIPLIGPCIAMVGALSLVKAESRRLATALFGLYCMLVYVMLVQTTSLWGDRQLAAEIWYIEKPNSLRALQRVAAEYQAAGMTGSAVRLLDRGSEQFEEAILPLQAALITCGEGHDPAVVSRIELGASKARMGGRLRNSEAVVEEMFTRWKDGKCYDGNPERLIPVLDALLENPRIRASSNDRFTINRVRADLYFELRNFAGTMNSLEEAWNARKDFNVAVLAVALLLDAGLPDEARTFVNGMLENLPSHPFHRREWIHRMRGAGFLDLVENHHR